MHANDLRFTVAAEIREIANRFLSPKPRSLAIFGSFAGGSLHETSDIDILLIGDDIPHKPYDKTTWFSPLREHWRATQKALYPTCPKALSPLVLPSSAWMDSIGLRLSLSSSCWVLWDDGVISFALEEARAWIRSGRWRKKDLPRGGWVWIPKEQVA